MILGTRTKYGQVEGVATETKGVALFRGIPYARPPVGKYRWREPEPPDAWEGVRKCEFYGPACIQPEREKEDFYRKEFYQHRFHRYPPLWGEDCLYLNIWTPAETSDDGLPVMIWIHGGGYRQGYSHEPRTNGEAMARSGIVVVSVNYRLNIFGFFAHPALSKEQKGHSGNYGILDQAAALKWVRENIREFGGDPDNVTIFGESGGGRTVGRLLFRTGNGCDSPDKGDDPQGDSAERSDHAHRRIRVALQASEGGRGKWDAFYGVCKKAFSARTAGHDSRRTDEDIFGLYVKGKSGF